jgi:AcrR family transcriptional regulator
LDEVRIPSGISESLLYHHFSDKDALVHDVVALQASLPAG